MDQDLVLQIQALLLNSFTNTNNQDLQRVTAKLNELSNDIEPFFKSLVSIITSELPETTVQIKNSAATQLRNFIRNKTSQNIIQGKLRGVFGQEIINLLSENILDDRVRGQIGYCLFPLLAQDAEDPQNDIASQISPFVLQSLLGNDQCVDAGLRAIKGMYSGMIGSKFNSYFFASIAQNIWEIGNNYRISLINSFQGNDQSKAIQCASILTIWGSALNSVLQYFNVVEGSVIVELLHNYDFGWILQQTILVQIPDPNFQQPTLFSVTTSELANKINQFKLQMVRNLNTMLAFYIDNVKDSSLDIQIDASSSYLLQNCHAIFYPVNSCIQEFLKLQNYQQLLDIEYINELIVELLHFIEKIFWCPHYQQLTYDCYQSLMVDICTVLIATNQEDFETFQELPDEFVNLASELCEGSDSDSYRSCAALLIHTICNTIDPALKFLLQFTIELIKSSFQGAEQLRFTHLSVFSNSSIVNFQWQRKIDIGILIINLISMSINDRVDLLQDLIGFMSQVIQQIDEIQDVIVQCRLCQFIQLYMARCIINDKLMTKLFEILLKYLYSTNTPKAIQIQVSDAFQSIITDSDFMSIADDFINENALKFVEIIPQQEAHSYFQALEEISIHNPEILINNIAQLVRNLMMKISQIANKSGQSEKIIVDRCWNIILNIAQSDELPENQLQQFEGELMPLIQQIQNPQYPDLEDQIIRFQTIICQRLKQVTLTTWNIVNCLNNILNRNKNALLNLNKLINTYIIYGTQTLMEQPIVLQALVELINESLRLKDETSINAAWSTQGALLYQTMFYVFQKQHVLDQQLPLVINILLQRAQSCKVKAIKARLYGAVLMGAVYNPLLWFQTIQAGYLNDNIWYLSEIMKVITQQKPIFTQDYDRKIAVMSIMEIIGSDQLPSLMSEQLTNIFASLIDILAYQKKDNKITIQQTSNPDVQSLSIQGTKIMLRTKPSKKQISYQCYQDIKNLISPIKDIDEYDYFRQKLRSLQQINQQAVFYLSSSLSPIYQEKLKELIMKKRIILGNFQGDNTTARKIVKVKRRNT